MRRKKVIPHVLRYEVVVTSLQSEELVSGSAMVAHVVGEDDLVLQIEDAARRALEKLANNLGQGGKREDFQA